MAPAAHGRDRGTRRKVPRQRQMAIDIALAALHIPSFPVHRCMQLGAVEDARKRYPTHIGWAAILAYTYARISQDVPELRDIYVEKPIPYLYRHPNPVASITVHRLDEQSRERLVWGRLIDAHAGTPAQIQSTISQFSTSSLDEFFRDGLKMEKLPSLIRRIAWRILMRWSGRRRAKHLGTFSISNLGGWGALNAHHPLVTATSLSMGPIQSDGRCDVVLLCDHRVLDGALAARVLETLERRLCTEMVSELTKSKGIRSAA